MFRFFSEVYGVDGSQYEICRVTSSGDIDCYSLTSAVDTTTALTSCPTGSRLSNIDDDEEQEFVQDFRINCK